MTPSEQFIGELSDTDTVCFMLARRASAGKLVGDTLLAAAFVSYAGPFTLPFRKRLVEEQWAPDLVARNIPLSEGFHPLGMLASDASKVLPVMPQHTPSRIHTLYFSNG